MSNQFSSKHTFKFVNALYKKAKVKAYRDMLEAHQVSSKSEFIRRSVDGSLESTRYWLVGYADKSARIKQANELWKCGLELHASRHFSPKILKLSTFKKLNEHSGLLAILLTAREFPRDFTWAKLVLEVDSDKVVDACVKWLKHSKPRIKRRNWCFATYATNYYNSYRSWLNKIGAIKQTTRGRWKVTDFGRQMTNELDTWYSSHRKHK